MLGEARKMKHSVADITKFLFFFLYRDMGIPEICDARTEIPIIDKDCNHPTKKIVSYSKSMLVSFNPPVNTMH